MGEAGTNLNQHQYMEDHDPSCSSCTEELESCGYELMCEGEGKLDDWAVHRLAW